MSNLFFKREILSKTFLILFLLVVLRFETANFSAKDFIISKRKKTALPQLKSALERYSQDIHGTLVELINAKYSDFVSLSAQMSNVDKHLEEIQNPIRENHQFAQEFSEEVKQSLLKVKECLEERKHIALRKSQVTKEIWKNEFN